MPFWMDLYFMDAVSPVMEQMIMFHDHSMVVIFSILIFLLFTMLNLINSNIINLMLMEEHSIEIIWTLVPVFLLFMIAIPSLRLLYMMDEIYTPDVTVKIIGCQWYWFYEYTDMEAEFDSFYLEDLSAVMEVQGFRLLETDAYLMIPMSASIRFLVTSYDVIHSWTVQSMGFKVDAIPGRLNQTSVFTSQPGLFYGQCSEICGMNHSLMPISVMVVSMGDFIYNLL